MPRALVLHVRWQLIHEALPPPVDEDPGGLHHGKMLFAGYPIGKAFGANCVRIIGISVAKAVGPMEVPHVPQLGAKFLSHANTVASIGKSRCAKYWLHLPVLSLHLLIGFEAAAGQHDATLGLDTLLAALAFDHNAAYLTIWVGNQRLRRGGEPHPEGQSG